MQQARWALGKRIDWDEPCQCYVAGYLLLNAQGLPVAPGNDWNAAMAEHRPTGPVIADHWMPDRFTIATSSFPPMAVFETVIPTTTYPALPASCSSFSSVEVLLVAISL
jgi:hypothetical protein